MWFSVNSMFMVYKFCVKELGNEVSHLHYKIQANVSLTSQLFMCMWFVLFFGHAKDTDNISCTGTKPTYCYYIVDSLKYYRSYITDDQQFYKTFWGDLNSTVILMMFRDMISEGELRLAERSTAHQGPWNHQFSTITKSYCLPIHPFPMYDPNKHGSAWSARWIWGSPPPLLCSFSRINSSSGEPERSVCQVLSPEKNRGKTKWSLNLRTAPSKLLKGMLGAH